MDWKAEMLRFVGGTVLICLAAACGAPADPPAKSAARRPNVLLISLDACRADHLGAYGYSRDTSPFIDELADRGIRFSNAFVNTLATTTSHVTILSSLYQETHRVEFDYKELELPLDTVSPGVLMVQEILGGEGYQTLAVTPGGRMSAKFGVDRGFAAYEETGMSLVSGVDRFVELVASRGAGDRPIFGFFHTVETHSPYDPPAEYRELFGKYDSDFTPTSENLVDVVLKRRPPLSDEDLRKVVALYDAEIRYTDDQLRRLFARLDELGFFDSALVILTADHGEEFGEHGGVLHRGLLYDEFLHVPLIVVGGGVPAGVVEPRLVSSIDIAPTILNYVGMEPGEKMEGRDLLSPSRVPPSEEMVLMQYRGQRYGLRTREWKFIENLDPPSIELYHLPTDPGETLNVAGREPDRVVDFAARIEKWRSRTRPDRVEKPEAIGPSQELLDRLRSLGYVGGPSPSQQNR